VRWQRQGATSRRSSDADDSAHDHVKHYSECYITSATATLDPALEVHECEPVADAALASLLAATILPPRNTGDFALNGVVSLRTTYEGESWTYLAARVGPTINGQLTTVAVWALPDGQSPVGVQWSKDTDGDQRFDLDNKLQGVVSSVAETGPYFWNDDRTRVADCALGAAGATNAITRMSLAQYQQLTPGRTTLDQLYALVGDRVCEESSESTIGGITTLGSGCRPASSTGPCLTPNRSPRRLAEPRRGPNRRPA
jgi:hypothetical protein